MNWEEYYIDFMKRLDDESEEQLISSFNREVGNPGSGIARSAYLYALKMQFIKRSIDFSEIGNETTLSFARKVRLEEGKLIPLDHE